MNFSQSFRLAIKSLMTSKVRALLTMLGIIIGVGAVIIITSLGNGLTGMVEQQVEKLGINQIMLYDWGRGGSSQMGSERIMALVEENPEVFSGITPWVGTSAVVRLNGEELKKTGVYGVSEAMYNSELGGTLDGDTLAKGRYLTYLDVSRRQNVCVVGAYVDQVLFHGDALGKSLSIGGESYTVIGVLARSAEILEEGCSDDDAFIPYENALRINQSRYVTLYQITATSRDMAAVGKDILKNAMESFYDMENAEWNAYAVQTMAEQVAMINSMMGVAMAVLVAIAAISLLVGGIGIMNIMLVSVTERTREIGIRKSLGAKRRDIRSQFVIEAGTTSAIGGVLGIGFGCLVASGIGSLLGASIVESMGASGLTFNASPNLNSILIAFGVSVAIGILFGYLPANKAAKLNPIDALRYD